MFFLIYLSNLFKWKEIYGEKTWDQPERIWKEPPKVLKASSSIPMKGCVYVLLPDFAVTCGINLRELGGQMKTTPRRTVPFPWVHRCQCSLPGLVVWFLFSFLLFTLLLGHLHPWSTITDVRFRFQTRSFTCSGDAGVRVTIERACVRNYHRSHKTINVPHGFTLKVRSAVKYDELEWSRQWAPDLKKTLKTRVFIVLVFSVWLGVIKWEADTSKVTFDFTVMRDFPLAKHLIFFSFLTVRRSIRLQFECLGNRWCLASIWIHLYFHLIWSVSCVTAGIKKNKSWLISLLNFILFVMLHPSSSTMTDCSISCPVWFDFTRSFCISGHQIWHFQSDDGWWLGPYGPRTHAQDCVVTIAH